ncbi:MAG: Arc family DNA binding domain-containing protein [Acidobacteria bacterium]|uniref:Arc family DNA binding domain-containing protein n=1 Tax=Candidatus Polarisedimenticola svalbardensis TaxID=2886004 RepID=A0A8J6Y2M8_9BACT|nr:Arc family DNA binding domain-containing protein [Candidatus Polarisedimenticola svalbardensis]
MAQRKKFLLRIDPTLWEELNRWASADLRSVNGQIEFILKQAVNRELMKTHDSEGRGNNNPE